MTKKLLILTILSLSMCSCVVFHKHYYTNKRNDIAVIQDCNCFDQKEIVELQDRLKYFYLGDKKAYFTLERIEPGKNGGCHHDDCIGLFLIRGSDNRTGYLWEYPVIRLCDTMLTPMVDIDNVQQDSIQLYDILMNKLFPEFDSSTVRIITHRFMIGRRQVSTWRYLD